MEWISFAIENIIKKWSIECRRLERNVLKFKQFKIIP
jgi:hypothetical protein